MINIFLFITQANIKNKKHVHFGMAIERRRGLSAVTLNSCCPPVFIEGATSQRTRNACITLQCCTYCTVSFFKIDTFIKIYNLYYHTHYIIFCGFFMNNPSCHHKSSLLKLWTFYLFWSLEDAVLKMLIFLHCWSLRQFCTLSSFKKAQF